jgi:hypothetical protein
MCFFRIRRRRSEFSVKMHPITRCSAVRSSEIRDRGSIAFCFDYRAQRGASSDSDEALSFAIRIL